MKTKQKETYNLYQSNRSKRYYLGLVTGDKYQDIETMACYPPNSFFSDELVYCGTGTLNNLKTRIKNTFNN